MSNRRLTLKLHSVSPLHIADASSGDACIDSNGRIRNGKLPSTTPITRTERRPLIVPKSISGAESDERHYFPYIKTNNLVGRLRRFAQDVINESFVEKGKTISDSTYRGMSCGAISGTPKMNGHDLNEIKKARENVYMGIFGGGNQMHTSGIYFGDMIVKHSWLNSMGVISGEVSADSLIDCNPYLLTAPVTRVRRDRLLEAQDINIDRVIDGGFSAAENWAKELGEFSGDEGDETNQKKDKKVTRLQLRNLIGYEVALSGLDYQSTVAFRDYINDAQMGLFIESLMMLAKQNALGGITSKGLGRFNLVVEENEEVLFSSVDGKIVDVGTKGEAYLEALESELEALDLEEMESFFNG